MNALTVRPGGNQRNRQHFRFDASHLCRILNEWEAPVPGYKISSSFKNVVVGQVACLSLSKPRCIGELP